MWRTVYKRIKLWREAKAQRGDIYAAAAGAGALGEIDQAIKDANIEHRKLKCESKESSPENMMSSLRGIRSTARYQNRLDRCATIDRSLDAIYRLTHAKETELKLRSEELSAASHPHPVVVPEQQALGQWLHGRADAAHESEIERSYFTQLARELDQGRDPWTVSQQLLGRLPEPGDAGRAERVRGAHRHLLQAMAGRLSLRAALSDPGGMELPRDFYWITAYRSIKLRREADTQRGDACAAAASAGALREIDQAFKDAYFEHRKAKPKLKDLSPENMASALRVMRHNAKHQGRPDRCAAIDRTLDGIYRLTHAKDMELKFRSDELSAASHPLPVAVPDQQALGKWLRGQAGAAQESEIECSYYTQLAKELDQGRDPWTASRQLIGRLPEPGDADRAERLQGAHRHLVHAMAGSLSPRASLSEPGGMELPERFNWTTAYRRIKQWRMMNTQRGDVCAAAAGAGALREIEEAVRDSDIRFRMQRSAPVVRPTESTLVALRRMRHKARFRNQQDRYEGLDRALERIYRLTHAKEAELTLRSVELSAASYPHPVAVPDQQALGQWLHGQVDAVPESDIEHSYFTQLAQELAQESDPWTLSRRLIGRLPEPGDAEQAERMRGAHCRLVQAMAGNPPQPQAPPRPGPPAVVEPLARESQASASRRQEMVQRLRSSNRLSQAQVDAFRSAVAEAADTGAIGESGSRPEAWAMGLLERIQQSVERPFAGLTALEKGRISADWKRFGELLESLESAGHL